MNADAENAAVDAHLAPLHESDQDLARGRVELKGPQQGTCRRYSSSQVYRSGDGEWWS